jgi:hypothetical protein
MPSSIISPFPVFNDLDGSPLENGYIYIGQSNLNPETAPVNVFWDAARTIPAPQPIRTIGGFPSRNGSPSNVYVENDTYSITVRNSRRVFVYSAFDQSDAPTSVFDISTQVITATAGQTTFTLTTFTYLPGTDTLQVYRNGLRLTSVTDYLESNTSTVTMTSPAALGDEFLFQGGAVITGNQTPGTAVSFIQAGIGAVTRNMQDKARESVSVLDFGAVGDGVTDDTAAIQAAIDSLGTAGGTVLIANGMKCLVDNNLTVKGIVSLRGPNEFVGNSKSNEDAPYNTIGGILILNSSATITLNAGASLTGLLIYRKGMVFPTKDSSAFAGTAVTANGDDISISKCMILGFNKAVYSSGWRRARIEFLYHDNTNGIEIANCLDVSYIRQCHAWPFATVAYPITHPDVNYLRYGTAYTIRDIGDWAKITDCFEYCYYRGFSISNANYVTLIGCSADNYYINDVPSFPNSIGFEILGNSYDCALIGCQSSAQASSGIYVNTTAGLYTKILGTRVISSYHGVLVHSGDVGIDSCSFRNLSYGVSTISSTSRICITTNRFNEISANPIYSTVSSSLIFVNDENDFSDFNGLVLNGSITPQSIASASTVNLPHTGIIFNITGTTSFGTLSQGWNGRTVTLVFSGVLTIFNGTASTFNMRLNGAANFVTASGSTLTLQHNGTQWYEIGRSA